MYEDEVRERLPDVEARREYLRERLRILFEEEEEEEEIEGREIFWRARFWLRQRRVVINNSKYSSGRMGTSCLTVINIIYY